MPICYLNVFFCMCTFVYRTLCGMNVSCQNLVCTGSRGTSASESSQAFARCSSITRDKLGGEKAVHANQKTHKPGQTLGTGSYRKAEASPKLQDGQIKAWNWKPRRMKTAYGIAQSPNLYTNAFALAGVFLWRCVLWIPVWQSADENTQTSLSVTAKPTGCACIYCIFLYYTEYPNE